MIDDDDNNSTLGNGDASGLIGIDINPNGSIRLIVTGDGDFDFVGDHEEAGGYKAVVEVFDAGNNPIDEFSFTNTLQTDMTDEHTFANSSWIGGSFSVNLDNTVDGFSGGDVDFFTFTGLTPNAMFSAETSAVGTIDTLLGWYSDTGTLLAQDDDSGTGVWSQLAGTVPSSGQLTFAVTDSGGDTFVGEHGQQEFFNLQLSIDGSSFDADFDGDGDVDADDLTHPTLGWQARYGNGLDGNDFFNLATRTRQRCRFAGIDTRRTRTDSRAADSHCYWCDGDHAMAKRLQTEVLTPPRRGSTLGCSIFLAMRLPLHIV